MNKSVSNRRTPHTHRPNTTHLGWIVEPPEVLHLERGNPHLTIGKEKPHLARSAELLRREVNKLTSLLALLREKHLWARVCKVHVMPHEVVFLHDLWEILLWRSIRLGLMIDPHLLTHQRTLQVFQVQYVQNVACCLGHCGTEVPGVCEVLRTLDQELGLWEGARQMCTGRHPLWYAISSPNDICC